MSSAVAKAMFAVTALLLGAVFVVLYLNARPPASAQEVAAQFRNAFPLLEGMHVRVGGAVAGSVGEIEVTDEGLAEVTLILSEEIDPPRADAVAAIRQQDTTGDSYVDFDPGSAAEPLPEVDGRPTIACDAGAPEEPCENTLVAPRFDDLLNAFGPAERAGVKLILVELANALAERGDDLNAAALELRPALVEANEALTEVGEQNEALRALITDAEAVTRQGAARREELGRLIGSLQQTLEVTAAEGEALDAGLERLPQALRQTQTTLAALRRAAVAGRPLAAEIGAGAPGLANVLRSSPEFFSDLEAFIERTRPTLDLTRRLARAGAPTIEADPQRVVTGAFDLAPALSNLLTGVLGDDNTIRGLFGDDSRGVPGAGTLDGFGLGAVTVEPGNQAGYPPEHASRYFWRISAKMSCESFGVPVGPGCLSLALSQARGGDEAPRRAARGAGPAREAVRREHGRGGPRSTSPGTAPRGSGPLPSPPRVRLPRLDLGELLDGNGRERRPPKRPGGGSRRDSRPLSDLLDFLLR